MTLLTSLYLFSIALLSWLTKLGTKQGNFQYIQSSEDIPSTMNTTLELLELGDRNLYIKIGENDFLPIGFDVEGHGRLVLTGEASKIEGQKVSVFKDQESGEKFEIETPPVQVQPGDPIATSLTLSYIQSEITRLTNEIINYMSDSEEQKCKRFNEISEEATAYDEQLNNILQNPAATNNIARITGEQPVKDSLFYQRKKETFSIQNFLCKFLCNFPLLEGKPCRI